jgi:hypothetical protein
MHTGVVLGRLLTCLCVITRISHPICCCLQPTLCCPHAACPLLHVAAPCCLCLQAPPGELPDVWVQLLLTCKACGADMPLLPESTHAVVQRLMLMSRQL